MTAGAAALVNVRIVAPVVTGQALASTVGAGSTAQLGAMRISEEVDALEVMGIKSISLPGVHPNRRRHHRHHPALRDGHDHELHGGAVHHDERVRPVLRHLRPLLPHAAATRRRHVVLFMAILIAIFVMINHCYFGYNASGGPVGVGEAVGKAMRASLILIVLVVLFTSLALYGANPNFNLTV